MLETKNLKVECRLCLNQRLKAESCSICQDSCHLNAIVVDDSTGSISINDQCNACGLCVNSCPSQAFSWTNTTRYPLQCKDGSVNIYCQKVNCEGYVQCLANLNVYELVYLALHRELTIYIDTQECNNCNIAVMAMVKSICQDVNEFLKKIDKSIINLQYKQKADLENVNRRQFFSVLFTKLKQSVIETLPLPTEVTDYRSLVIEEINKLALAENSDAAPLFWGMKVSDKCAMCGMCTKICKNNALRLIEVGLNGSLQYNQDRCIGCGACIKLCPTKAMEISKSYSRLGSIGKEKFTTVNTCLLTKCRVCKSNFIDRQETGLCDSCQRKAANKPQAIY